MTHRDNHIQNFALSLMLFAVLALTACTGRNPQTSEKSTQPKDTVYTQQAAMMVYDYDPIRALQIIDSAVIVGNLSEVWADVNRARIYSQSQMTEQLDSLLEGPKGIRLDTARAIAERLMLHDSVKASPALRQNVLEILIYTARQQHDSLRWLQRSRELVDVCRQQGAEAEALRTEAELAASLYYAGQKEQSLARLDSVTAALGSLEPFRFNELDALIIASKRKIGVLNSTGRYAEVLPVARRIIELLDDYGQHPDRYHDGTYREPADSTERNDYIRFYRSQAQNLITSAYAALGNRGSMEETFYEIEHTVRDATASEHLARYNALRQQLQRREAEARAERNLYFAIVVCLLLAVALAAMAWYFRQMRIVKEKNRALVRQIDEAIEYKALYQSLAKTDTDVGVSNPATPDASTFTQIHDAIIRERLYLDPTCDRQMLTDRFGLSKERLGSLFVQYSDARNVAAFINGLRLSHAAQLLTTQPDMDIREVAAASGFATHRYFSTCFKQRYGLSPTDYRTAKGL